MSLEILPLRMSSVYSEIHSFTQPLIWKHCQRQFAYQAVVDKIAWSLQIPNTIRNMDEENRHQGALEERNEVNWTNSGKFVYFNRIKRSSSALNL